MTDIILSRRGFGVQVPSVGAGQVWPGVNLIYSDPRSGVQQWTVALCAYRFPPGQTVPNAVGGAPYRVAPIAGIPYDSSVNGDAKYVCDVQWAVDGAQEQATVDWYPSGNTFCLQGSNLRVYVRADQAQAAGLPILPYLQAYMTERQRAYDVTGPTYTSRVQAADSGGATQLQFYAPPRATAYRMVSQGTNLVTTWRLIQQNTLGTQTKFDASGPSASDLVSNQENLTGNKSTWYPLHSQTQRVELTWLGIGIQVFALQWLLDLG